MASHLVERPVSAAQFTPAVPRPHEEAWPVFCSRQYHKPGMASLINHNGNPRMR